MIENDSFTLALMALAWTLEDASRADRLLALTGIDPADLRSQAGSPDMLGAVITFLEGYEPDLIACASAIGVSPSDLIAARRELEG